MHLKLFFLPSKAVASRITEAFNFVWPTAAAIWNLRWQVQGLVGAYPSINERELLGRFVDGSGIQGVNLRAACIDTTWEAQQEQFAKFLLFEFCAFYESWCELITEQLSLPASSKKDLQFPGALTQAGNATGVTNVLALISSNTSPTFNGSIKPSLVTNRKYSPNHLQELLACYRYFKELRNCLIHGSSSAFVKLAAAESAYAALTAANLGLSQRPEFVPYTTASHPKPSLRGVVGFGEVVLKLVCTIDIELSSTSFAERDFKRRWKTENGSQPSLVASVNTSRRASRIGVLTRKLDLPSPVTSQAFLQWLRSEGLIFY